MEFLEAGWIGAGGSPESTDRNFPMAASRMENLKIQPFEQTLMQEGGGLEVGLPARYGIAPNSGNFIDITIFMKLD